MTEESDRVVAEMRVVKVRVVKVTVELGLRRFHGFKGRGLMTRCATGRALANPVAADRRPAHLPPLWLSAQPRSQLAPRPLAANPFVLRRANLWRPGRFYVRLFRDTPLVITPWSALSFLGTRAALAAHGGLRSPPHAPRRAGRCQRSTGFTWTTTLRAHKRRQPSRRCCRLVVFPPRYAVT